MCWVLSSSLGGKRGQERSWVHGTARMDSADMRTHARILSVQVPLPMLEGAALQRPRRPLPLPLLRLMCVTTETIDVCYNRDKAIDVCPVAWRWLRCESADRYHCLSCC